MNREIKFRIWNKKFKQLYYFELDALLQHAFGIGGSLLDNGCMEGTIKPWMQYTGLKDINGKEIYEGDIIKTPEGHILVIFWCPNGYWSWFEMGLNLAEIIGNSYENSELLENTNV